MNTTRKTWLDTMLAIAHPVLDALSRDCLTAEMPIESKLPREDRAQYTYLEALGRTLTGMAPWLDAEVTDPEELALQQKYGEMARQAIHHAVTPDSRDFMNFSTGFQPIVDAAFLAHGVLRAPHALWEKLPDEDKRNLVLQMKRTRTRAPHYNNWLLFAAMIESFLYRAGEDYDPMRIDYAIRAHISFYKGDGFYGDGVNFRMDYYNSFVIQPMLVDVLSTMCQTNPEWTVFCKDVTERAAHYATYLEHLIMPDGSYPVLGRSSAYRFGAFQMLSQAALEGILEDGITPAQVRCALTAVIKKIMSYDNFDENGFLKIGVCGSQPNMGEEYISTGSLYLCSAVFLPLGLPESDPFWTDADADWTMKKMYRGENLTADHALRC